MGRGAREQRAWEDVHWCMNERMGKGGRGERRERGRLYIGAGKEEEGEREKCDVRVECKEVNSVKARTRTRSRTRKEFKEHCQHH